jgi:hypothetical protein
MSRRRKPTDSFRRREERASGKVGSDPKAVHAIGGKGDFGVSEAKTVDRNYASANTRASDRGATHAKSSERADGARTSGAGANVGPPGSGSGGDIDLDIVGVGTGGSGISASGPDDRPSGPDDSTGTSDEFASGPPAQGEHQTHVGDVGGPQEVNRGQIDPVGGTETDPTGRGADAVNNPNGDDASAGEISSDEAAGEDNS